MSAEIHTLNASSRSADSQYQALIGNIKNCLNERLSDFLEHMFNSADDVLFQLAQNAESNEDQARYFDTMRLLRLERESINRQFAEALRGYLRPKAEDPVEDPADDELSLVAQDEMEELVAISTMHSKAMNAFGDSINHLEARLEMLATKYPDSIDKRALIPKNFCEAFRQALANIELSNENRLVVYKLFDQEVCSRLGDLYQTLNKLLIDENILPQIKLDKPTNRHSTTTIVLNEPGRDTDDHRSVSSDTRGTGISGQSDANQSHAHPQAEISRIVSQFISGEAIAKGPGIPESFSIGPNQPTSKNNHCYDRRDILRALSNLQANFIQHDEVTEFVDAETFKRALMIDMGSRQGVTLTRKVNQVDEKTIDFIEMLFEVIVKDSSISELVTNLLLRLQIPVIKIAMLDQQLFASSDHPARRVLNLIGQAGRSISDKNDESYVQLEDIIDQLLEEFDVDVVAFQTAVDRLNELIQHDYKITEENEQHTQKQILHEHARQIVLAELQDIVYSNILPKPIYPLVLKYWSTLMFRRYIHYGKQSHEWKQAVSLLKQLLNSLQPITTRVRWLQLDQSRFSLITRIKEVLYESHQDKVKINDAIETLSGIYQQLLDDSPYRMQLSEDAEQISLLDDTGAFDAMPDLASEVIEPSPREQQREQALDKIARLPSEVRPGAWFVIFDGPDQPKRRLKLSVILMDQARLVFVDRLGIKVLEKDADSFAEELRMGHSSTIANHSLFEHALSQVINSLEAAG